MNSSLLILELNSKKNENSLKQISKYLNDYNEELKILINKLDEHIKIKRKRKTKRKRKRIRKKKKRSLEK